MSLGGGDRHDSVAGHVLANVEHEAVIPREQAVAKNAEAPGKRVRRTLYSRDRLQVGRLHEPDLGAGFDGGAHARFCKSSLTMHKSVQAVAFCNGLRSKYAGWYVTTSGVPSSP